jgi:TolB protein
MRSFAQLFFRIVCLSCLIVPGAMAQVPLNIDIVGIGARKFPIAIAHFDHQSTQSQSISAIIRADLERSGRFTSIDVGTEPVAETASVAFDEWQAKGADAFVAGSVTGVADGQLDIRFRLHDIIKQQDLGGLSLLGPPSERRMNAHRIADAIYQKLLGEPGMFATRLLYVVRIGKRYQLQLADSDGENARTVLTSAAPIISPVWSPDGTKIAYVSFESKKPVIYLHDLPSGQRMALVNQKGSNSAPAWSPDGRQLAVALSLTGNTQIYLLNVDGSGLRRLSHSSHIDTEPQFSPDGKSLYFTSDRGGVPQIYRMPIQGEAADNTAVRITFNGAYNTSPRISADGRQLAYISRIEGAFRLTLQNLDTGELMPLTETRHDESPSFAANSKYILYATQVNGRRVLAIAATDRHARQILPVGAGNAREPAWGPSIPPFQEIRK